MERSQCAGCASTRRDNATELRHFLVTGLAQSIAAKIQPRTALDVGCGSGSLVAALRDRGIEAFGVDASEATHPMPQRYDLIICLGLPRTVSEAEAGLAVGNLCQRADDILFSPTAEDLQETTTLKIPPIDLWAGLFAQHGFYRDVGFDPPRIPIPIVRFRKLAVPVPTVVRAYERQLSLRLKELQAGRLLSRELIAEKQRLETQLAEAVQEKERLSGHLTATLDEVQAGRLLNTELMAEKQRLEAQLAEVAQERERLSGHLTAILDSAAWQLVGHLRRLKSRLAPPGSRRDLGFKKLLRGVNRWLTQRPGGSQHRASQ